MTNGITNSSTSGAVGRGFSFTAPSAASNSRTLRVYVGVTNTSSTPASPAKLELFWGSNTVPALVDVVPTMAATTINYVYDIQLTHPVAGTNLKLKWSTNTTSASHKVTLQSAVLMQD